VSNSSDHGIQLPQDWELIGFFEAEPRLTYDDEPWCYNEVVFETHRNGNVIECAISPSYGELKLIWLRDEQKLVELDLCFANRLTVHSEHGCESIQIDFDSEKYLLPLILQLKPTVQISWGVTRWL
jgi:hypothetical protein